VTPSQLYARDPERRSHEVGRLNGCYYHHIPELGDDALPSEDPGRRVELRFYKDWCFDSWIWALASVWLDGTPFMIVQNAGPEGEHYSERFVTDGVTYTEAVKYLKSICLVSAQTVTRVVSPDDEIDDLTEFYGNRLGGHFKIYQR